MPYVVLDNELNRTIVFQHEATLKERYTTKGNLFHRYEDKYGNWGVSFNIQFLDFLKTNKLIKEISNNVWKTIDE